MKFLFLFLFFSFSLSAQETRWLDLEWDSIDEAKGYEIELFEISENEEFSRGTFQTSTPKWSYSVAPGKYYIRLRSIDERGVPGEWSDKVDVKVKVLSPVLLRPSSKEKLVDSMVKFEWKEVSGASFYQIVVRDISKKVLHNLVTTSLGETVYLKELGHYQWAVFSLESGDEAKEENDLDDKDFKKFERVGGELHAPTLKVQIDDDVKVSWDSITDAQSYEVDYLPPRLKGEKNGRYTVINNFYVFGKDTIKEGITTVTVKSLAKGYQDSSRSLVKIVKNDTSISAQDNVTGKSESLSKPLTQFFWRNQLFWTLLGSRLNYMSKNKETDTQLKQNDLTGMGLSLDWIYQDRPESRQHRVEGLLQRFSSSDQSGIQSRVSYHYIFPFPSEAKLWTLGLGASSLMLPMFFGDRLKDAVESQQSTSLGPEFMLGMVDPLGPQWHLHANLYYSQQLLYLSSPMPNASSFGWLRGQLRFLYNTSPLRSYYIGCEYQRWTQEFDTGDSQMNGWTISGGLKSNW